MKATATPAIDHTLTLRNGRTMGYAEWGDPDGRPVVLLHGAPGSRLFCPDLDATFAAGVRLLTIDRPGYGRSDALPGRRVLQWAEDFSEFADALKLPGLPVIGWSSGGPYALACGVGAHGRVTSIGLAASTTPLRHVPENWPSSPIGRRMIDQLDNDPRAAVESLREQCRWYADDWRSWIGLAPDDSRDADRQLVDSPANRAALDSWFQEGARQGSEGLVEDRVAELAPWGFSVADVDLPVTIWWGDADRLVAYADADYLVRTIAGARLVLKSGDGHLLPMTYFAEMLLALN